MSKQNVVTEKSTAKSQPKPQSTVEPRAGMAELAGESLAFGGKNPQAARLSDPQFSTIQRQILAFKIGRIQGNAHLQRVVIKEKKQDSAQVQLQPPTSNHNATPSTGGTNGDKVEQQQFAQQQAELIGNIIHEHILQRAGFAHGRRPTTPAEALRVVRLWGITIQDLVHRLPEVGQSLSKRVRGRQQSTTLAQQQQRLIQALTPTGQQTFQRLLRQVQEEPFWREYLNTHTVYIFPDIGENRYRGYLQRGTRRDEAGRVQSIFVIHISKDRLETGQVEASAATLIHELSHAIYEPTVTNRSLRSLTNSLAHLLADHQDIAARRRRAANRDDARQMHVNHISQFLYERTGYAEEEIFVHLQQLTHQPPVQVQGTTLEAHRYILEEVERYVAQLQQIGLPPHILTGILESISRRVAELYDRRIAAASRNVRLRERLTLDKRQAILTLRIAITQ